MLGVLQLRRRPYLILHSIRFLHPSSQTRNLIGPPDPISNIRPVIYTDIPPSPPSSLRHPYSLSEFQPGSPSRVADYELQSKLQRQQLDAFDHSFWTDSNIRFEAAKEVILSSLPLSSTPLDKENALSVFYKQWVMQETARTNEYTEEWRRRNMSCLLLEARVNFYKFMALISDIATFKKTK